MSTERLSKLQKWILEFLYNREGHTAYLTELKYHARRSEGLFNPEASRNNIEATLSRSLRNLYQKGLIELVAADPVKEVRIFGGRGNVFDDPKNRGNLKFFWLSDEGEAKAKEFLNVKNVELNNKKKDVDNDQA